MTGRSPAGHRRRQRSSTRLIVAERIPSVTWPGAGFNRLYAPHREPGPIVEAACWAHARRKFYELAQVSKAPIAAEAVTRIDRLFAIEPEINGHSAEARLEVRREQSARVVHELEAWLRTQRERTSRKSEIVKAIDYTLKRRF